MDASYTDDTPTRSVFLRHLPLLAFIVLHFLIFRFVFKTGIQIHWVQAENAFRHYLPYRDYALEYPPLSLAVLLPPRLFAEPEPLYGRAFSYEMLFFDVICMVLLVALAGRLGRKQWQVLWVYTAFILAIGSITAQRYDLFPTMLVLLAVYGFVSKHFTISWTALALGTGAKLFPILLTPLLVVYQLMHNDGKGLIKGMAVFVAVLAAIFLPWAIMAPQGLKGSFIYQFGRGLQLETTFSSWLMVGQLFGLTQAGIDYRAGAMDLVSPAADTLARVSSPLMVTLLAGVYSLYCWRMGSVMNERRSLIDSNDFIVYSSAVLLIFLMVGKVLSPQFLIWLFPLLALLGGRNRWWLWGLFILAAGATQYVYPYKYWELMLMRAPPVAVLAIRNLLLIAFTVLLLIWEVRDRRVPEPKKSKIVPDRSRASVSSRPSRAGHSSPFTPSS
ncbi:MAG: DUF2029 domain-containing protein [Chloroflexi bacterium]|nr:DUF2029 domain-containing protein [Chloroflexota bacterium]